MRERDLLFVAEDDLFSREQSIIVGSEIFSSDISTFRVGDGTQYCSCSNV